MDSRLETLQRVLQAAMQGMSEPQLNWHPDGKWCAAEILEHLYLTYTGTIKGFERILEAGKPLAAQSTFKQRMQGLVVFGLNYMPSGRKSPERAMPRGLSQEIVRAEIAEKINRMDQIIAQCEARFPRRPLLDHPVLGPLTAVQWRKFHLVHGRHHARQIEQIRQQMKAGFTN